MANDNRDLLERLESRLEKIEDKLDKHLETSRQHSVEIASLIKDVDWTKGYVKITLSAAIGAFGWLLSYFLGGTK